MLQFISIIFLSFFILILINDAERRENEKKELVELCNEYNWKMLNNVECLIKKDWFIKSYWLIQLKQRKIYNELFKN